MKNKRYYTTRRRLGDRVRLTKAGSIKIKAITKSPTTGTIIKKDLGHVLGEYWRPFKIQFDDGADGWYSTDEIVKLPYRSKCPDHALRLRIHPINGEIVASCTNCQTIIKAGHAEARINAWGELHSDFQYVKHVLKDHGIEVKL